MITARLTHRAPGSSVGQRICVCSERVDHAKRCSQVVYRGETSVYGMDWWGRVHQDGGILATRGGAAVRYCTVIGDPGTSVSVSPPAKESARVDAPRGW